MGDRDALLAAIRTSPDDDLCRLVYADFLDENGQPDRAEFIRVQVELANKPCTAFMYSCHENGEHRCECRDYGRYDALRTREIQLVEAGAVGPYRTYGISPTVCEVAHNCGGSVVVCDYRRGFARVVRGPLAAFWAEMTCDATGPHHGDRCDGGRVQTPNAQFTQDCRACGGTGGTVGPNTAFAELACREPVVRVDVTDKEPLESVFTNQPASCRWLWVWNDTQPNDSSSLPATVYHQLRIKSFRDGGYDWAGYPSTKAARDALSDALLRLAHTQPAETTPA